MADFFIRRPIVAMVISILTVIVGAISLSRLPIAEYPQVSPTMIQVTTTYRGAAAEAVMESVATPIESKVNGVDKLLYQVRVGNYLGLNYGLITRISETELGLREIVQDAAGEWIERVATLQLQERSKK